MKNLIKFLNPSWFLFLLLIPHYGIAKPSSIQNTHSYLALGGYYTSNILISTGQIAEVTSNIEMAAGTKITIQRGAMLICINKSINSVNNARFLGIEVLGNPTINQSVENSIFCNAKFTTCVPYNSANVNTCFGTFNQGVLYFKGSTLLNSDFGIVNGEFSLNESNRNGFLYIKNSYFKNNIKSISIINSSKSSEIFKGYIEGNVFDFSIDNYLPGKAVSNSIFLEHIRLENYIAIKNSISGNIFAHGPNGYDYEPHRMTGINSYRCGYRAENNNFYNLSIGIMESSNRPQALSKTSINNNNFVLCTVSIYNFAPEKIEIFHNNIVMLPQNIAPLDVQGEDIDGRAYSILSGGIINFGASLFDISQNSFKSEYGNSLSRFAFLGFTGSYQMGQSLLTANIISNTENGYRFDGNNARVKVFCTNFKNIGKADISINPILFPYTPGSIHSLQGELNGSLATVNNYFSKSVINGKKVFDLYTDNTAGFNIGYYANIGNLKDNPTSIFGNNIIVQQHNPVNPSFLHCQYFQRVNYYDGCGGYINGGNSGIYSNILNSNIVEYNSIRSRKSTIETGGITSEELASYENVIEEYDFKLSKIINLYSDAFIFVEDSSLYYLSKIENLLDSHETKYSKYLKGALYLEIKDFTKFNNETNDLYTCQTKEDSALANYFIKLMNFDTTQNKSSWISYNFEYLKNMADTLRDSSSILSHKAMAWVQELIDSDTLNLYHGKNYMGYPSNPEIELTIDSISDDSTNIIITPSPNPFSNSLTVTVENLKNIFRTFEVQILDLYGNEISTSSLEIHSLNSNNLILNTSAWSFGYYFITVYENGVEVGYKLILK